MGRAWLYKALNDSSLESFFNCFLDDQANVKKFYIDLALLRDKERLSLLLTLLSGLDFVSFRLELNVAFFDLVSHVPRSATERQNSLDNLSLHSYDSGTPGSTPVLATPEDGNSGVFESSFSSKCSRQTSLQDELILKKVNEGQLPSTANQLLVTAASGIQQVKSFGGPGNHNLSNGSVKRLSLPEQPTTLPVSGHRIENGHRTENDPRNENVDSGGAVVFLRDRKRRSKKKRSGRKGPSSTNSSTSPSVQAGNAGSERNSGNDGVQDLLDATARTLQGQISDDAGERPLSQSDDGLGLRDACALKDARGTVSREIGCNINLVSSEKRDGGDPGGNSRGDFLCSKGNEYSVGQTVTLKHGLDSVLNNNTDTDSVCSTKRMNGAIVGLEKSNNITDAQCRRAQNVRNKTDMKKNETLVASTYKEGSKGAIQDGGPYFGGESSISPVDKNSVTEEVGSPTCTGLSAFPSTNGRNLEKTTLPVNFTEDDTGKNVERELYAVLSGSRGSDSQSVKEESNPVTDRTMVTLPIDGEGGMAARSPSPTVDHSQDGQSYESLFAGSSEVFGGIPDSEVKSPGDGASGTESEGREVDQVTTPGTVKIDSNTKLHLMLEVFVHSEEKYLELFQVSSNHNQGEVRPGMLLLSTFAIYLLRNSEKKKRYKAQVRIPLEDLDSITVSMNYQILFIVFNTGKKLKTIAVCTGDEALSKAILSHLSSACKESSTFPPSIVTDALQHQRKLTEWATAECRHSGKPIKLYHYGLIHWDDAVHPHSDPDMSVYRPVIHKTGHLAFKTKESLFLGSFWQPGYFELKDCILSRFSQRGSKKVQWSLHLSPPDFTGCRRLRQKDRGHCFEILQAKGSPYIMSCDSERQLSSWLAAICQAMAEQQSLHASSPLGLPVQPCCSLVTSNKLLLFHEDSQTAFIRCLASCDVASITCLRSAEKEPNFVIIDFLPEESETPWIFYFVSWMEALKFQTALSSAYFEAVQTTLPLKHLADSRLKQRTRACLAAIKASKNNKTPVIR